MNSHLFSQIPATDKLLTWAQERFPQEPILLLKKHINNFLDQLRTQIKENKIQAQELEPNALLQKLSKILEKNTRPHLKRVINATGIVVHTNQGRSLLAREAVEAVEDICLHYSNLELDLKTGKRGSRYSHVEEILCTITGSESALVVNNNAAAVLITLETLAQNKEVIVSRGELVEIGGSFRIPDVMKKSGAILKEVGTTNRTHLRDYEQAISENTGALLKVHTSNYRIIGFHKEVSLKELVALGKKYHLPVIKDLGSGNLISFSQYGLTHFDEPTVKEILKTGVDVVSFSGDKLLGGPQAGIIVGKKEFVDKIKKNPLNRALRIDKMTLAALEATLKLYLDEEKALQNIPTLKLIFTPLSTLNNRAATLSKKLKTLSNLVVKKERSSSKVGGGSLPEREIPTYVVKLKPKNFSIEELRKKLLETDPPLIGRVEEDWFCLDVRTIFPAEINLIYHIFKHLEE